MSKSLCYIFLVALTSFTVLDGIALGTPLGDNSWSILWQGNVFENPTNYTPNPQDFPSATLLETRTDQTHLVWYPGSGFWENSVFIARTWLYVQALQAIPVRIAGDDGHSLYVNDSFIIGLPFSDIGSPPFETTGNIILNPGWNKVEAVLYNGPINAGLILQGNGFSLFSSVVDDMNSFGPIPEPSTLILFVMGFIGIIGIGLRRRQT
jgi:hypothetical protein